MGSVSKDLYVACIFQVTIHLFSVFYFIQRIVFNHGSCINIQFSGLNVFLATCSLDFGSK